jgi:hypothetical protein
LAPIRPKAFDEETPGERVKRSRRGERNLAKRLGGRPEPASGSLLGTGGDVGLDDFQLDRKATGRKSIGVSIEMLKKIENDAAVHGREPGLVLVFEKMPRGFYDEWLVIPLKVVQERRNATGQNKAGQGSAG